mgnify:CR=1 FL=1
MVKKELTLETYELAHRVLDEASLRIINGLTPDGSTQLLSVQLHGWYLFIRKRSTGPHPQQIDYFLWALYDHTIHPHYKEGPNVVFSTHGNLEYLIGLLATFSELAPNMIVDMLQHRGLLHNCAVFGVRPILA